MSRSPNVLIILADQHRQDCLSVYGNPDIKSPHLAELAGDGMVYDNHFCNYPVCTPSRYSLLTGLYAHQHLGTDNHCTLPSSFPTFPRILRERGYHTAAVGKMHYTPTYLDVGFGTMRLAEQDGPGRFDDDYHKYLKQHNLLDVIDLYDQRSEYRKNAPENYWQTYGAGPSNLPEHHYSTTWITDQALQVLDGWSNGGNLLMVGYIKPHHPFDPPGMYAEMYDPDKLTLLPGYTQKLLDADIAKGGHYFDFRQLDERTLRNVMAMYYGTITHIDDSIGRMISLLKDKSLYDDTLIIYTSDHGDYMGFHHMILKGGSMYDPLMKIPLIVKRPGRLRGRYSGLSSTIDVPSIIFESCGVSQSFAVPGLPREFVYAEYFNPGHDYMVRSSTHKLLVERNTGNRRLFDMQNDPLELTNLIGRAEFDDLAHLMFDGLISEFMFKAPVVPHLDPRAQEIHRGNGDSPEAMKQYMRDNSPIKPVS